MRTIVDLPEEQIAALDGYCEEENVSRAEAVRRAVNEFVPTKPKGEKRSIKDDPGFGSWKRLNIDGLEFQEKMRAEWDHRP
jgi:hypothetical protein